MKGKVHKENCEKIEKIETWTKWFFVSFWIVWRLFVDWWVLRSYILILILILIWRWVFLWKWITKPKHLILWRVGFVLFIHEIQVPFFTESLSLSFGFFVVDIFSFFVFFLMNFGFSVSIKVSFVLFVVGSGCCKDSLMVKSFWEVTVDFALLDSGFLILLLLLVFFSFTNGSFEELSKSSQEWAQVFDSIRGCEEWKSKMEMKMKNIELFF